MSSILALETLPKADLHVHLNGCIETVKIQELFQRHQIKYPEGLNLKTDLKIKEPVSSFREYFKPWHFFKRLPVGRNCLKEMVQSALETLKKDNVVYAEIRNSPFNISDINDISLEEALEWVVEAIIEASEKLKIKAKLIPSLTRRYANLDSGRKLLSAIKTVRHLKGIVGLDLTGYGGFPIDTKLSTVFNKAKDDLGLGITIHAGETGSLEDIIWAIDECNSDRIGHGLAASRSPKMLEKLARKNVCIEVCLTSNLLMGSVLDFSEHPVISFVEYGVPFILCADNPQVNDSNLTMEYQLFLDLSSRGDLIDSMFERQMHFAFSGQN